jgi:hypothetical protein
MSSKYDIPVPVTSKSVSELFECLAVRSGWAFPPFSTYMRNPEASIALNNFLL